MSEKDISIKNASTGEFLGVAGGNYRIVISGEQTGGNYAVIEMNVPPGGGPPPHSHSAFQEMFYVVEGEIEFKTEKGKENVAKGGFVNIPFGGAIHCFQNTSGEFVRLLCTVVPAGLENIFREIGQPVKEGEILPLPENTPERIAFIEAMDKKYGQKTYPRNYLDNV
ncbi:Cupin domain-containing protein [Chitinophaga costaii]|uniref:Cupin domain-containing protein n=1 Tax=Chitinophaga costaii TaxID=1335309 RepID=A0A1C4G6Q8_9BACT|nr:cupin domain-containing protein [Chitinophaga costaii]PUZ19602.1 cupin domain-containing protein [Chitinophaga costaii]SCC63888.1 Cupin domain-containing protein [Chitinophaga costaii]